MVSKPAVSKKDDDSEEDEEDDVADIPVVAVSKAKPKDRRISVSAESMDPEKLKSQISQVKNIPKSPSVEATLLQVVGKSPLLKTLDKDQKETIVKAFSGPLIKEHGVDVILQGDIGDTFYLLEEGSVDVYIKKKGSNDEVKVHSYKPGDAFGELAIMYNAPRAATCRVNGTAKLWVLDRVAFKVIVVAAAMQKREKYKNFLTQVPILETLNEMEVMTLADSLAEETYEDGQTICKQGEPGDTFYIVKDGIALCFQTDEDTKEELLVATLSRGQHFGEIALLTSKPRQATVRAKGLLKTLAIDRATFTRVFGSMDEIMKRNMEMYNKYAAQGI